MPDEAYTLVSVPKKSDNAGRPTGKKSYLIVFDFDDVVTYTRDAGNNVEVTAFAFAEGKKPIAIYTTSSTVNIYHQSEGDADAKGFIHHVDYETPGSDIELSAYFENNINRNLGVISVPCSGDNCRIAGTPCQPLQINQDNSQDNNEGNKHTVQMQSILRGPVLGHIKKSLIPPTDNAELNAILGLTSSEGA